MKNSLPQSNASLISLGLKAGGALQTHQDSIGIMHNTETVLLAAVATFTSAVDGYGEAQLAKSNSFTAQALASVEAGAFLSAAVDVLTPFLGRTFSPDWASAFGPTLAIPSTLLGRLEGLRKVEKHLKTFPLREREDIDPKKIVTAARAKSLRDTLTAAIGAVASGKSGVRTKKGARTTAKQALNKRLRGLINELGQLIPETDPRWSAFGFNAPGETQTPEVVQGVVLEGTGPGLVRVDWPESSRAERYQVEVLVAGQDAEFRRVETVQDSDTVVALPPGAQVKVRVVAVNEAGASAPSTEVEITVPPLAAAA